MSDDLLRVAKDIRFYLFWILAALWAILPTVRAALAESEKGE